MFCYFMWNVDLMVMSSRYKDSVIQYEKSLIRQSEEQSTALQNTNTEENTQSSVLETADSD